MRFLLTLLFIAILHAGTCPPLPPCYYVKTNLTVLIAEALDTPTLVVCFKQSVVYSACPGPA
jgi:hypothetical protein